MGEAEATRICNAAADRGTAIHLACEQLVANEDWREISFVHKQDFLPLKKYLEANVDLVFASEHQMFSKTLKLAGTTDLIANHKGKFAILDYKTSSRIKYIDEIDNYFLQLAAYAVMLFERYQLKAEELTILMSIEGDPNVAVFSQPVIPWIKKLMKLIKENS